MILSQNQLVLRVPTARGWVVFLSKDENDTWYHTVSY